MNNGLVSIPKIYIPHLSRRIIHLVITNKGFFILIPVDKSIKMVIEEEIRKLSDNEPEIQIAYAGTLKLKRENRIYIPSNIRKLVGINTKEVIIVGCGRSMEIWDRNVWEREMRKTDGE